jgi:hypothetical protein
MILICWTAGSYPTRLQKHHTCDILLLWVNVEQDLMRADLKWGSNDQQ